MNPQTRKKINRILKAVKKKVKLWQILLIVVLLTGNTFAWFIYTNNVSNQIDVHVRAWNVTFENNNTEIVNYLNFSISSLYPGMVDYRDQMLISSKSEVSALIDYKIMELNIMGDEYVSVESREEKGETPLATDKTSAELEDMLKNDFPFSIYFSLTSSEIASGEADSVYSANATWAFESGDDDADTFWGNKAYAYMKANNTEECIKMKVKVTVNQKNG